MKTRTIYQLIIGLIVSYLFGAFYSVSFNIACWSEVTRFSILMLAGLSAIIVMMHDFLDV